MSTCFASCTSRLSVLLAADGEKQRERVGAKSRQLYGSRRFTTLSKNATAVARGFSHTCVSVICFYIVFSPRYYNALYYIRPKNIYVENIYLLNGTRDSQSQLRACVAFHIRASLKKNKKKRILRTCAFFYGLARVL